MRKKDKNGLTHQQELFCQYVVDAYGTDTRGVLVNAYRKAYNCKNDARIETHYSSASVLMNNPKIAQRIEDLQKAQAERKNIERDDMVSRNVKTLEIDPLEELFKVDEETGMLKPKQLSEIRKDIRKLLHPVVIRGRVYWLPDKKHAEGKLIDMLGFEKAKELTVNHVDDEGIFYIGGFDSDN